MTHRPHGPMIDDVGELAPEEDALHVVDTGIADDELDELSAHDVMEDEALLVVDDLPEA